MTLLKAWQDLATPDSRDGSTPLDADRVGRLTADANRQFRVLDGIPDRLAGLLVAARRDAEQIANDRDLSAEAKARRINERYEQLKEAIGRLDAERLGARRALDALTEDTPDTEVNEQLLHEMRLHRTWARVKSLLEAGQDAIGLAQRAVDSGDRDVFRALRAEWPAWALARDYGDYEIKDTLKALDALESPLLSAPEAAARMIADKAARHDLLVKAAVDQAATETWHQKVHELLAPPEDETSAKGRMIVVADR